MKKQQKKLDFKKKSILELRDSKLHSVRGGTLTSKSIYYPTTNTPTFDQ